ncbi:MAG: hypothetical protein IJN08_00065, partial [Clostridia bacterium]|nr:hypothetical protein [Clostridia bacterium]
KAEAMDRTMTRARAIAKIFFIFFNPFQKFMFASEVGNRAWVFLRRGMIKRASVGKPFCYKSVTFLL